MALTNDQLRLLDSCPALAGFKDWFIAVDELLSNDETVTEEPAETDDTEGTG
jgi:hypothetical protein